MINYALPNANATVVTVTSTATLLTDLINTAGSTTAQFPSTLDGVDLVVEADSVRVLFDGNTPTSTKGVLLTTGTYKFRGVNVNKCRLIRVGGSNISVGVQLGYGSPNELATASAVSTGGGGTGSPGGANDSLQYRINGTTFGGMTGVNSDGDTIILDNGTFLQTIDKDDNTINVAGYLGELLFFGDIQHGNQVITVSSEVTGTIQELGVNGLGKDGFSTRVEQTDITDPENPINLQSYEMQASLTQANFIYESDASYPGGYEYGYGTYALTVANNEILQKFAYAGNNDGLARVTFAERWIEAYTRDLGLEDGTIIDRVSVDGVLTEAVRIGDGGLITFKLLPQFDAQLAGSGVAYAAFETGNNTGTYAYQFGAGTTVPTDATAGWSGGAIFGDSDATPGYNRMWLNTGTSSSSAFRRIAIVENTNQLAMADGTAAAPFYSFPTSLGSGLYLASANTPAIATNGTVKLQVNSNSNIQANLSLIFGASTTPTAASRGFGRGTSTLIYNVPTGDTHEFTVNSVAAFRINSVGEQVKVTDTITASTTQTQGQQPLVSAYNIVTVVANIDDVVTLPTAVAGQIVRIKNEGVHKLQVFPATGDSINNGAVNASEDQNPNTFYMYIADDATNWTRVELSIA